MMRTFGSAGVAGVAVLGVLAASRGSDTCACEQEMLMDERVSVPCHSAQHLLRYAAGPKADGDTRFCRHGDGYRQCSAMEVSRVSCTFAYWGLGLLTSWGSPWIWLETPLIPTARAP
jgi:hypothetical protein